MCYLMHQGPPDVAHVVSVESSSLPHQGSLLVGLISCLMST